MEMYTKCPNCGKERSFHHATLFKNESPSYEFCEECKKEMLENINQSKAIAGMEQGPWPRSMNDLKKVLYIQSVGRALRPSRKSLIIAEYQAHIITQRWVNLLRPTAAMLSQPHISIHDETVWDCDKYRK